MPEYETFVRREEEFKKVPIGHIAHKELKEALEKRRIDVSEIGRFCSIVDMTQEEFDAEAKAEKKTQKLYGDDIYGSYYILTNGNESDVQDLYREIIRSPEYVESHKIRAGFSEVPLDYDDSGRWKTEEKRPERTRIDYQALYEKLMRGGEVIKERHPKMK